jgi:hypothetical protein
MKDFDLANLEMVPPFKLFEVNILEPENYKTTDIKEEPDRVRRFQGQYWSGGAGWESGEDEPFLPKEKSTSDIFFYSDIKSLQDVAVGFVKGKISRVQCFPQAIQYYNNNSFISSVPRANFSPGLTMIERDREHLILTYQNNKKEKLFFSVLSDAENKKETTTTTTTKTTEGEFSQNKSINKWKLNYEGKQYVCKAKRSESGQILEVRNSIDGAITVGDFVHVEAFSNINYPSTTPSIKPYSKVECCNMLPKHTGLFKYVFYTSEFTEQELYKSIFRGKVSAILKLQTKDTLSGADFEIVLTDVKQAVDTVPVTTEIPKETNQPTVH